MAMSRFMKVLFFSVILFGFIFGSNAVASAASPDYWPTEDWRTSSPEQQGMHSGMLADMLEFIQKEGHSIDSATIVRNGYLVTDAYFHPFRRDATHIIHSCTKSITSALVGIALDRGYIKNVNQPILEFFPEKTIANLDERKRAITLKHLLTMASGLETRDSYLYGWEGLMDMKWSADWAQYVLDRPMADTPGKKFEYSNGVSYLLSVIVQKATNMRTLNFAKKYLFGPLGISDVRWKTSPQGIDFGYGEMWLRPRDMAKIGWLYLNKGRWEEKQIISEAWVEASTRGHISATLFDHYGYQWWIDSAGYYAAVGYKGQRIFVVPAKNMVVVFTSNLPSFSFSIPQRLLSEYIIPAAASPEPLPANPKNKARLDSLTQSYSKARPQRFTWISEEDGVAEDGVFVRTAPPAFRFEYPNGSRKTTTIAPNQVMGMETPGGVGFQASVADIPEGMTLADVGPKAYVFGLKTVGSNVKVISNEEISLKDGTKAYRTNIKWLWKGTLQLRTLVVSAFKDGKWIYLAIHPRGSPLQVAYIVESLTFK